MYILGLRGLYTTIQPRDQGFSSDVESRGHGVPPEGFDRGRKILGRGGYIVVYSPTRPNIYNIYTTFSVLALRMNLKLLSKLLVFCGAYMRSTRAIYRPARAIYLYSPRTRAIYSNIALSGRNFDFLGLYYRGILNKKVKILQGT